MIIYGRSSTGTVEYKTAVGATLLNIYFLSLFLSNTKLFYKGIHGVSKIFISKYCLFLLHVNSNNRKLSDSSPGRHPINCPFPKGVLKKRLNTAKILRPSE